MSIVMWLGLFLLCAFFVHWRLKSAFNATYSYFRWDEFGPLPPWTGVVLALRWPMRIVAAVGGGLLLWAEWQGRALSAGLSRVLSGRWSAALLLVVVGLASGSYYLLPGDPAFSSDAQAYIAYSALTRQILASGQLPIWTNYSGMGMPHLQFYGPLYATAVALVGFLIPDLYQATKLVQLVFHITSVMGMYAFVSRLAASSPLVTRHSSLSSLAGFVAAWAYGFTFYRYHAILFNGILHLGAHLAFLPWQFYCLENLIARRERKRWWGGFALLGGASVLAHPNYGAFVNAFALLYGLIRIWIVRPDRSALLNRVVLSSWLLAAFAGALIIGAYPVVGSIFEKSLVTVDTFQGAGHFLLGPIQWQQAFTFLDSYWTSDWFGGYVGVSITLIALAGFVFAAWTRDTTPLAPGVAFALALYLALGPAYLPFENIVRRIPLGSLVYVLVTPGRYLAYFTFFATAAAGLAVVHAADRLASLVPQGLTSRVAVPAWTALLIVLAISADVLPPSMQANSLRPPGYAADWKAAYAWLREGAPDPASRVLDPSAGPNSGDIQQFSGLPSFGGIAHETPALAFSTILQFHRAVGDDLKAGALRAETRDLLYLTNTGSIVTDLAVPQDEPADVVFISGSVSVIANLDHSPILASPQLKQGGALPDMNIDPPANRAEFIPVPADPWGGVVLSESPPSARVLLHELLPQHVRLTYDLSAPAYVQLSYSYYPYLDVLVDGRKTDVASSALGLIVFRSEAGQHTVELRPYLSPLRVGILIVSGLVTLAALAVVVWRVNDGR